MSNPHRAQKDVTFGGRQRRFVFNFNSLAEMEGELGEKVEKSLSTQEFRWHRALVWACLRKDSERPSVEQVGDWMGELLQGGDPKAYWSIMEAALEAFNGFWPKPPKTNGELKNDQSPEAGTGMPSSSRPDGSESNLMFSGE